MADDELPQTANRPREEAEPTPERFPGPMVINASGEKIIFTIVIGALCTAVGV